MLGNAFLLAWRLVEWYRKRKMGFWRLGVFLSCSDLWFTRWLGLIVSDQDSISDSYKTHHCCHNSGPNASALVNWLYLCSNIPSKKTAIGYTSRLWPKRWSHICPKLRSNLLWILEHTHLIVFDTQAALNQGLLSEKELDVALRCIYFWAFVVVTYFP